MPCPSHFTPGKETQYPLYRWLYWSQGQYGHVQKILPPPRFDPQTIQPTASRKHTHTHSKCKQDVPYEKSELEI